jgi:hypothetical protein
VTDRELTWSQTAVGPTRQVLANCHCNDRQFVDASESATHHEEGTIGRQKDVSLLRHVRLDVEAVLRARRLRAESRPGPGPDSGGRSLRRTTVPKALHVGRKR